MGEIKKIYTSWKDVERGANIITSKLVGIDYVVGIPRGGLVLAVMISHRASVKHMTIDHLEKLEEEDKIENKRRILIVDDISDSGQTLKRYKKDGYTVATLDVRNTTITTPDLFCNWLESTDWVVYPWERIDSKTIQDYLDN